MVWIPKYRKKVLYGNLRKYLGDVFQELASQRECKKHEGSLDHVHMMISIPPKYSVAQVAGYIKGKSAIHIARTYSGYKQNFN
jgi:putative transposase